MALSKQDIGQIRQVFNDGIEALVLPRLDGIDERLVGIDERLDGIDDRLDKLTIRVAQIESEQRNTNTMLRELTTRVDVLESKLEALENDIKDIYLMLHAMTKKERSSKHAFASLGVEEKLVKLHSELLETAKQAGVKLPDHP